MMRIAEAGVHRDHLRRHDHEPGDAERDADAGDDLRQARGQDHPPEKLAPAEAEVLRRAQIDRLHVLHRRDRRDGDGKNAGEEDEEDRREIAHAEPENGHGNPGDGRNRAEDLDHRIERLKGAPEPAEHQPERHADQDRETEAPRHAEERGDDVFQEQSLLRQLDEAAHHFERRREKIAARQAHAEMPAEEKERSDAEWQRDLAEAPVGHSWPASFEHWRSGVHLLGGSKFCATTLASSGANESST